MKEWISLLLKRDRIQGIGTILGHFFVIIDLEGPRPYSLKLLGAEQQKYSSKSLLLCSTENKKHVFERNGE